MGAVGGILTWFPELICWTDAVEVDEGICVEVGGRLDASRVSVSFLSFCKGCCATRCGFKSIGTGEGRRVADGRGSGFDCCGTAAGTAGIDADFIGSEGACFIVEILFTGSSVARLMG